MSTGTRNIVLADIGVWLLVFFAFRYFASVPGHPLYPVIAANVVVSILNILGLMFWPMWGERR